MILHEKEAHFDNIFPCGKKRNILLTDRLLFAILLRKPRGTSCPRRGLSGETMKKYLESAVRSISESIRFDSSLHEGTPTAPFGQGAYDCLAHFLSLAESMGFVTHNYDGYAGDVEFGTGEEFAILCHLDVVPAGGGWEKDPFGGIVEDGKIWGRGAVDDKGPAICCLYAMKALKDEGFCPRKKIKLIVGCNEESGWACIEHYKKVAHLPEVGFSPDADFPVIWAEKGILHVRLHFPITRPPFLSLSGGDTANMVCDRCEAMPRSISSRRAAAHGMQVVGKKLVSRGKSAHGSTPEEGENAILPMLSYFAEKDPDVRRVVDCLFDDIYGLKRVKDATGSLTLSPDIIRFRKSELQIVCDIRYPATMEFPAVCALLDRFQVKYEVLHRQDPLITPKEGPLITTLLAVFEECTGTRAEPIAIGGGTYARALKCGAGFGPEMPGDEPVIHRPNEYITIERVELLLKIYKRAIESL